MPQTNVDLIRGLYAAFAKGDLGAVLAAMDPAIEWNEAEGHPFGTGSPFIGPQAVVNGVFLRLATEWTGFQAAPERFFDAGEHVWATGRYAGACNATGRTLHAQFAHLWTVRDGRAVQFQQYTDTQQWLTATGRTATA
jgi:ketosteroid isomerase-like protein